MRRRFNHRSSEMFLTFLLFAGFALARTNDTSMEDDLAPLFSVTTDQGKRITPTEFGGKLLVLNFWHTSCVPCVKELPSLSDFARTLRSAGLVVVAISGDEDVRKYRTFLRNHRVMLETHRDPSLRISKSFGTYMFPETYVIQDGRIVRKVVGGIDWMDDEMTSFVRARLKRQ